MKKYRFLFTKKEDAGEQVFNTIIDCTWADMAQAKESAKAYLAMMRQSYERVDIFEPNGTMWRDSGEFVENTNNII